jgi:hypothetical protein
VVVFDMAGLLKTLVSNMHSSTILCCFFENQTQLISFCSRKSSPSAITKRKKQRKKQNLFRTGSIHESILATIIYVYIQLHNQYLYTHSIFYTNSKNKRNMTLGWPSYRNFILIFFSYVTSFLFLKQKSSMSIDYTIALQQ